MKTSQSEVTPSRLPQARKASEPFFQKDVKPSFFSEEAPQTNFFFSPKTIQPKLTIGQPGDQYEQEADAMAEQVVQRDQLEAGSSAVGSSPQVQMKCAECEQEERLQKKEGEEEETILPKIQKKPIFESNEETVGGQVQRKCEACAAAQIQPMRIQRMGEEEEPELQAKGAVPGLQASAYLESRLNATKGSGSPLPDETRSSMESSFGTDFSGVRVHTNSGAVQMNQELGAQAFTHGSDVYFNSGKYDTGSRDGQRLLGHKLTHVVQQGGGGNLVNLQASDPISSTITHEAAAQYQDSELQIHINTIRNRLRELQVGDSIYTSLQHNLTILETELTRRTAVQSGILPLTRVGEQMPRPQGLPINQGFVLQPVDYLPQHIADAIPEGQLTELNYEDLIGAGTAYMPDSPGNLSTLGNTLGGIGISSILNVNSSLQTFGFASAGENSIGLIAYPRFWTPGHRIPLAGDIWGHTAVYVRVNGKIQMARGFTVANQLPLFFDRNLSNAVEAGIEGVPGAISDDIGMFTKGMSKSIEYPVTKEIAEQLLESLPEPGALTDMLYTARPATKGGCAGINCVAWATQQAEGKLGGQMSTIMEETAGQGPLYRTLGEIEAQGGRPGGVASGMPKSLKFLKWGGRIFIVAGIAMDVAEVVSAPEDQRARVASGVTGGFLGGLALGATAGLICGPGAPLCSIVLGIGFGIAGAIGGRAAGEAIYDEVTSDSSDKENRSYAPYSILGGTSTVCPTCHSDNTSWGISPAFMQPVAPPLQKTISPEEIDMIRAWIESGNTDTHQPSSGTEP